MNSEQLISEWIELYSDRLLRIAFMQVKDKSAAEDRVQETLITAYHRHERVPDVANPLPWLTRVLINKCHDAHRKTWREVITSVTPEQMGESSAEEIYLAHHNDHILHNANLTLPEKYRLPIVLFHFEDFSIQQIFETLFISVGATKTRLARGRKKLKEILKEESRHGQRTAACPPTI